MTTTIQTIGQFYDKYTFEPFYNGIAVMRISDGKKVFHFNPDDDLSIYKKGGDFFVIGCEVFSTSVFEGLFLPEISNFVAGTTYQEFLTKKITLSTSNLIEPGEPGDVSS